MVKTATRPRSTIRELITERSRSACDHGIESRDEKTHKKGLLTFSFKKKNLNKSIKIDSENDTEKNKLMILHTFFPFKKTNLQLKSLR